MAAIDGKGINPKKFHKSQIKFYVVLLPLVLFMILPIMYVVFHAFKPIDELFAYPPRFIVKQPTFENFSKLFQQVTTTRIPASRYLFNSIMITFATVVLTLLISSASGYALSKIKFKGRKLLFEINTLALMFVPIAVAIPRYLTIVTLNLNDTFLVHILPMLAMPVGLFLIKQFIDQIPDSLIEAAQIDGANHYFILMKVILPLVKPALCTVTILSFSSAWNSTEASTMFINNEALKNFAFYVSALTSVGSVAGQGMAAAAALIMFIPSITIFIIVQSGVMNTMAHSGIK